MRHQIHDEVSGIEPFDALEQEHIADAIAWIASGVELCRLVKPATPPKHLVSYFVVVDGDFVLLVDHRSAQRWLPTGGHVEPGEHPRSTVAREIVEELGFSVGHPVGPPLMITVTETTGNAVSHTDVSLWYLVRCNRQRNINFDHNEFSAAKWFAFKDIPVDRTSPHVGRFIAKLRLTGDLR